MLSVKFMVNLNPYLNLCYENILSRKPDFVFGFRESFLKGVTGSAKNGNGMVRRAGSRAGKSLVEAARWEGRGNSWR